VRRVLVIGIGAGDPGDLTQRAVRALNQADVFFVMDKGSDGADLLALRREVCERYIDDPGYRTVAADDPPRGPDVALWHRQRADLYERLLRDELADGEVGAFLVWGDPAFYDSTLRILDQVAARNSVPFTVEVVPGISAPQSLAARFAVPLHGVGRPVHITTGRMLAARGWPAGADDVVVMLDGRCAFTAVDPDGVTIYWGAYLGTPAEILLSGPLAEVGPRIVEARAAARARKGWMFDIYLLHRDGGG
jgi:precorrin-6A synthase